MAAEVWKHGVNDCKCAELGWVSIESYGSNSHIGFVPYHEYH